MEIFSDSKCILDAPQAGQVGQTLGKRSDTGIYQSADPDGLCGEEKAWISCILHCIRVRL